MSSPSVPLRLYGFALVNGDGTTAVKSPNLVITHGSTGNYIVQPAVHLDPSEIFVVVTGRSSGPFIFSAETGHGATTDGILVLAFNSASSDAASDEPFWIAIYTIGDNDLSTVPR